jgi:hypothetical protein
MRMWTSFRYRALIFAGVLSIVVLGTAVPVAAQTATKHLKLKNSTTQAVEYGLGSAGAPPRTPIVIQPGQIRELYPTPIRDFLYFRYSRTNGWAAPLMIPLVNDPVYKWKFVPGGGQPGCVGAPEIP